MFFELACRFFHTILLPPVMCVVESDKERFYVLGFNGGRRKIINRALKIEKETAEPIEL